jgi:hypothetical protein
MTHILCINDSQGQTQPWWINFLTSLSTGVKDIPKELKEWGATIPYNTNGHSDTIIFEKEEDLAWFLLKWA